VVAEEPMEHVAPPPAPSKALGDSP
jgi:hypothetical protein